MLQPETNLQILDSNVEEDRQKIEGILSSYSDHASIKPIPENGFFYSYRKTLLLFAESESAYVQVDMYYDADYKDYMIDLITQDKNYGSFFITSKNFKDIGDKYYRLVRYLNGFTEQDFAEAVRMRVENGYLPDATILLLNSIDRDTNIIFSN